MAEDKLDQTEAEQKLWKALDATRTGMLGLVGGDHMQPMTGFAERETNTVWFYTRKDTDLVRDTGDGRSAMYCLVTENEKIYACLAGDLSLSHDDERIAKYWNPVVAAWYPEGKDDPNLTLLRFDLSDAQIWVSEQGPVRFVWEVAKANLTKTFPDMGDRGEVRFQ
jgi:general stress protein 26